MVPDSQSQLHVAVLAGGDSAEREVSLRSGQAVLEALLIAGHHASLLDPCKSPLSEVSWDNFDVCFIALHGGAGEDGRVQAELDRLGVLYTGSSPEVSRLAMSKSASKERFAACDVPTPPAILIAATETSDEALRRASELGYPLIVKPDTEGSSVGLAVVESAENLPAALDLARRYGGACLVEKLIRGREFTVAVLDERPLPILEIVAAERVFSYVAKYHNPETQYLFDFELPDSQREAITAAALGACRAIGTRGLVRVDVMLDSDGRPWVLEVNTIPGMSTRSLAPRAAAQAGLPMSALCELLVRQTLASAGVV